MKVAIIGGGPSGLFLSILIKQTLPQSEIVVYEQNAADATFGFGVVMADTGLVHLRAASSDVGASLESAMRFNDRQIIVVEDTPVNVQRPGRGGAIPRIRLLEILGEHARKMGVSVEYEHRLTGVDELDADIIVGADGINSQVRALSEVAFETEKRSLSNHFAWFGVAKAFTHPALVFRTHGKGCFVAHYYPYSEQMSTFVAECDHQTWVDLGMDTMRPEDRQGVFEQVFASELEGYPLISNNSVWRQFPVIRAHNWYVGNRVLIGDAQSSAHFSIGSGTRIAMEDAVALAGALGRHPDSVSEALSNYVQVRQPQKQKLIGASEASFTWYENIREWLDKYEPQEFVYRFMTRTGRVDIDRLRLQYPDLVEGFEAAGLFPMQQKMPS